MKRKIVLASHGGLASGLYDTLLESFHLML